MKLRDVVDLCASFCLVEMLKGEPKTTPPRASSICTLKRKPFLEFQLPDGRELTSDWKVVRSLLLSATFSKKKVKKVKKESSETVDLFSIFFRSAEAKQ